MPPFADQLPEPPKPTDPPAPPPAPVKPARKEAAAPAPRDPVVDEIWEIGLRLIQVGKVTRSQAGSFIAGHIKAYGTEPVLEAMRAADREKPFDVREYVTAALLRATGRRLTPVAGVRESATERQRRAFDELDEIIRRNTNPQGEPHAAIHDDRTIDGDVRVVG